MDISEILNHTGEDRENYFNSVSPPVIQSSNFCFGTVAEMRQGLKKEFIAPFYTRGHNPTVAILRKKLAALEGSEDALVFASGSAAIAAAVFSVVKNGDHVICVQKPYSWTNKLLNNYLVNYGVDTTMVDGTKVENFENAIKENTKLIYLESPNSLTFELQDIEAVCRLAKLRNITTICDNSCSTPLFQKPIALGADMAVHSASKYLNGHSDVVAGVLCASKENIDKIFASEFMTIGGIISPHDAWLMLRGLRTLHLRLNRSAESAEKVIKFLENHPKVEEVLWPFSKHNPQSELAKKQMLRCGGLFSIKLKVEKIEMIEKFCDSLKRFLLACSWGGHESLVFPTAALYDSQNNLTPDPSPQNRRGESGIFPYYASAELPFNLIRFYIGLEEPEYLIEDIEQALKQ